LEKQDIKASALNEDEAKAAALNERRFVIEY
jgi:hypothetical protein